MVARIFLLIEIAGEAFQVMFQGCVPIEEAQVFPNFQYNSNHPGETHFFIDQSTENTLNLNFTGIKIGDVNDTNAR